jgi:hypothetical protein
MGFWSLFKRKPLPAVNLVSKVFTPGKPAGAGFVSRPSEEILLKNLLKEEGTQVLVWGESGAGKTSLVLKVLGDEGRRSIKTRCEATTTYDAILASAFDKLQAMRLSSASNQETYTVGDVADIGGGKLPAKFSRKEELATGRTDDWTSVVPAQLTSEALAIRLGVKGLIWVIEDFHKVAKNVRDQLADAMKVFSDESSDHPQLKMIVLGAAETSSDILEAPSNMDSGRLAAIHVPPLNDTQLGALLGNGKTLLNVDFSAVRDGIIRYSVGVANVTHSLASECCNVVGVSQTSAELITITDSDLQMARSAYVATRNGTMKQDFDVALNQPRLRKYQNYAIILRAIASLPERGAAHGEILARIRETHSEYPPGNLTTYLGELQKDSRKSLIRKTSEGLFRYTRPLLHAYAIARFRLEPSPEAEFWSTGLTISAEEQTEAVRLADEENLDAPVGD